LIYPLPFDSELFGYPVGKSDINQKWDESEFLKNSIPFQLTYVFSKEKLQIQDSSIQLVDTKITLQKEVGVTSNSVEVTKYSKKLNSDLESLAYESGIYSRFQRDSRLSNGEFRKLYQTWISEEIKNKQVYITPDLEGMLTLSFENEVGNIGLLAVSKEHQGKGWGRKLLNAAIFFTNEKGIKALKVATQKLNRQALGLYSSFGFQEVDRVYIYHFWNPNFS
jgi:ribosomal protein S18 acetylase RimI-like enzyme